MVLARDSAGVPGKLTACIFNFSAFKQLLSNVSLHILVIIKTGTSIKTQFCFLNVPKSLSKGLKVFTKLYNIQYIYISGRLIGSF